MTENEPKTCPKCGEEMTHGILPVEGGPSREVNWRLRRSKLGEKVVALECRQCGNTELYSTKFPQVER